MNPSTIADKEQKRPAQTHRARILRRLRFGRAGHALNRSESLVDFRAICGSPSITKQDLSEAHLYLQAAFTRAS